MVSCAKTAKPIVLEIPFGMLTWVDPRNHAFDGDAAISREKGMPDNCPVSRELSKNG